MRLAFTILLLALSAALADVDTKNGSAITEANNQDGLSATIGKADGQTIKAAGAGGGAGIAFRSAATNEFGITDSPGVQYPPGVQANDIILVVFRGGAHDSSGTPPTGFTKIMENDGSGGSTSIFWKRASGSETTETWTTIFAATEVGIVVTLAYSGCVTSGDAIDAFLAETSTSSTAKDISSSTLTDGAMVVGIIGFANSTAAAYTLSVDAGTERIADDTTPNGYSDVRNSQVVVNDIIKATAGAQNIGLDLGTATAAEECWIALKPAP